MTRTILYRVRSVFRLFLESEASGGLVLMTAAAFALVAANSPLGHGYHALIGAKVAGHTVETWINDGLMVVFFLLVGLEIKREVLHGQLRTWQDRMLPGLGALGGMLAPAAVFAALTWSHPTDLRGWAIPSATDIAFALGVLSLLGDRVPASLKVFLTALAVLDDLGAVLVIAVFYSGAPDWPILFLSATLVAGLIALNWSGVRVLWPYLAIGVLLWAFVWRSGVHPTVAGVLLAMTIPDRTLAGPRERLTPLGRLENGLDPWVAYLVLPVFAFANAGVRVAGDSGFAHPVTLGVAAGLLLGKQTGVLGSLWLAVKLGIARRPAGATWTQVYGVALLCGIGFTMSLFIGLLAFEDTPVLQDSMKIGVLIGSVLSAVAGTIVLSSRRAVIPAPRL